MKHMLGTVYFVLLAARDYATRPGDMDYFSWSDSVIVYSHVMPDTMKR